MEDEMECVKINVLKDKPVKLKLTEKMQNEYESNDHGNRSHQERYPIQYNNDY